ncbi:hypothetical protein SAY87_009752 [Trapa incisa]|uniref:Glutaredoxin domain-containing protein n=1 Tax=Trapa incisa TaxID=236973 RepID=A0AAN7K1N9_9MYRT|nr:hypothetical protein SAY87_009752 [Trapa incisa]
MANVDKKYAKPKSFFFNRSHTMHGKPTESAQRSLPDTASLERGNSFKKFSNSFKGKIRKLYSLFESSKSSSRLPNEKAPQHTSRLKNTKSFGSSRRGGGGCSSIKLPGTDDRIVVYFTSLRGIRRTYEDCYTVRMIFKGFRVWVDERDISMDMAYKKELQNIVGCNEKPLSLPQVFIGGKHMGGADVIRQFYETGELARILKGYPKMLPGFACDYCGGVRFMLCTNCSGSRKVFDENERELKRCLECNENGLIRCPRCCS